MRTKTDSSNDNEPGGFISFSCQEEQVVSLADEIAILRRSDLVVGTSSTKISAAHDQAMWVRYRHAGVLCNRVFRSAGSWRIKVQRAQGNRETLDVLEMDEWGRLRQLLPKSVMTRLVWNNLQTCDPFPATRLIDPDSGKQMLLFRSRLIGHVVEALHDFTEGGAVFQPVWVYDVMRLNPLLGIKLVRDESFEPEMRLSEHLALTGSEHP